MSVFQSMSMVRYNLCLVVKYHFVGWLASSLFQLCTLKFEIIVLKTVLLDQFSSVESQLTALIHSVVFVCPFLNSCCFPNFIPPLCQIPVAICEYSLFERENRKNQHAKNKEAGLCLKELGWRTWQKATGCRAMS